LVLLTATACGGDDNNVFQQPPDGGDAGPSGGSGGSGGSAGAAGGSAGAAGGSAGGSGGSGATSSSLGVECASDADCGGAPLVCLTSDGNELGGGGPAHGVCSADCSQNNAACGDIDPLSFCVVTDDKGTTDSSDDTAYCFPGCPMGSAVAPQDKCLGRPDLACAASAAPPVGFCLPSCRNDADCDGRVCDLSSGLCADQRDGTLPIGAECTDSSQCEGFCLDITPTYSVCSGVCRIGAGGCGEPSDATAPQQAACLLSQVPNLSSVGDAGFCVELCGCNDDCAHPAGVCEDLSLSSLVGQPGMCFPADRGGDAGLSPGVPCATDGGTGTDASTPVDASSGTDAAGGATSTDASPDAMPVDAASG
jgi:hypothetical protein